jgi:hypothetical protein
VKGEELWRVRRADRGPWRFSGSPARPLDLPDPEDDGYPAADPLAALVEAVGPQRTAGVVAEEFVANRRLWCLRVPDEGSLADLTAPRAGRGRLIPLALLRRLEAEHGIAVRPRPRLADVRTVDA